MMSELMTLEEVATYLRVTTKTIYRLLEKGTLPAKKVGRQWRFNRALIDNWLHQGSLRKAAQILVIDDDDTICTLFRDSLDGSGHHVTTVNESITGMELIKTQDFDLVFLDLKLPTVDGAELFKQIRQLKPDLPVTIITGYTDSDQMMKALTYGPLGVMSKPFRATEIVASVESYLRFGNST